MAKRILLAGESWLSYTTHVKGFDAFYTSVYEEGAGTLIAALTQSGYQVDYLPNHRAVGEFPFTVEDLSQYDCVILSDIGSNTLLLHPDTFAKSVRMPNRCETIRDYVFAGGALLMVGGYMAFSGVDAKAKYGRTAIKEVLPVICLEVDDLSEHPEGVTPVVAQAHPALGRVPGDWPYFLGYNLVRERPGCDVAMTIAGDPFLAFGDFGKGRSGAFMSDCAPHWGPPEFVNWAGYQKLWQGIVDYLTER
ncbi:glutamine amidotransferase [Bacillota bacterium Meth-B3]